MRDRAGTEGDVDVGVELEDAFPLSLGVAAADGDHPTGVASLPRRRLTEVGSELRIGLLADRARVEDDDVGVLRARRLAEPELLEHALDPLGVVSVHLAAERGHVVAPHRVRVAAGDAGAAEAGGVVTGVRRWTELGPAGPQAVARQASRPAVRPGFARPGRARSVEAFTACVALGPGLVVLLGVERRLGQGAQDLARAR